tara:strand:+ start:1561 stop:1890 length:330 start_codon:yes stop_codon:yes gene_type:complete
MFTALFFMYSAKIWFHLLLDFSKMDCPCGSRISILTQSPYFINSVVDFPTAMVSSILTSARQHEPLERSTFEIPEIKNHPNPSGFQKYLSFYTPFLIALKILIPLLRQQ